MYNKKGFTLVEIITVIGLLAVIAGIFTLNMIKTINKNRDEENKNIRTKITSAAEAYVSTNPDEIEKLYEGYGYVDIPVGELRSAGLLDEELKDAETGARIGDDELVRISLQSGDYISTKFPLTEEEKTNKSYTLVAEDLYVEYDKDTDSSTWCSNDSKAYFGLFDPTVYNTSNYTSVTSKLYLMDNKDDAKGAIYQNDHRSNPVNLRKTSCNVNPQVAGTYTINYVFNDPETNIEKTTTRNVYVRTSGNDVVSFTAVINNGRPVALNAANVPIKITEKYKDSTTKNIITTVDKLTNAEYSIENFSTASVTSPTRTAKISTKRANSDGSTPTPADAVYTVTDSFIDIIKESPNCTGSKDDCYFRGTQDGNYIKYYNKIFRIYRAYNNTLAIIYDGNYATAPYGQIGACINSCCNDGRYAYISLGDKDTGVSKTMDSYLDDFYNQLNGGETTAYLKSQSFPKFTNAQDYDSRTNNRSYYNEMSLANNITSQAISTGTMTKKIALLQAKDYKEIASCTSEASCAKADNYLTGSAFWLLDFYGARFGVGHTNYGVSVAEVYEYSVNATGTISKNGSTKLEGSQDITTESLGVRPTIELQNPKITTGTGSKDDPYIVNVG